MAGRVSLAVNGVPINLDHFVAGYIDRVIGGIIGSLHDTGDVETLELDIDSEGQVDISLNSVAVPLKDFPNEIIRSTVLGMIAPLKGVEGEADRLTITISRL